MADSANRDYAVQFSVDYPDRDLNRWTTFFRVFMAIPILIVLAFLTGAAWSSLQASGAQYVGYAGGIVVIPTLLMIVFRQKYPRWWFDWNLELTRFSNRVGAYLLLLNDQYPSTDEEQTVHLDYTYPQVERDLNRWLPLVKWILAIPHYFILFFLGIAVFFIAIIAWFAILFTARYPRGLFDFVVGVMRWDNRVIGYTATLITDEYPPFSLSE